MIKKILEGLLRRNRTVDLSSARHYTQGGMWGRNISFPRGWDKNQAQQFVMGHWTPKPSKGDLLFVDMQSGKTAVCIFDEVYYYGDPPDMFKGTVSTLGYENELGIERKV